MIDPGRQVSTLRHPSEHLAKWLFVRGLDTATQSSVEGFDDGHDVDPGVQIAYLFSKK